MSTVLVLLLLLQVKHMFADFFLQTPIMLMNRAQFVHPGRALHCLVHALGSLICFLVLGIPFFVTLLIVLAEWVAHYLIDFGKGVWSERAGHSPADASYWRAFGADQMLHQITYVAMVAAIA